MADTFDLLAEVVKQTRCKPGWGFALVREDGALRLRIGVLGPNSRDPNRSQVLIHHLFPVPVATYNARSWRRWVFECCRRVENHELGEWFVVGEERPFAPLHGPGEDPYTVHEFREEGDARIAQDGSLTAMGTKVP